jgi:hypothetical protein
MKKLTLLLIAILGSFLTNGQICLDQINSVTFSPVTDSSNLQLDVISQRCDIHHFNGYTLTSNNSNHIINLCYQDTGLLMPSTITSTIILPGLNIGNQNFTINSSYYFGPPGQSCSSNNTFNPPITIVLPTTPLTQPRIFLLSEIEFNLKKVILFPNPNSGDFTLQLPSENEQAQITITDMFGKKILSNENYFSGNNINLKSISKGLYLAKVVYNQTTETLKFIVK